MNKLLSSIDRVIVKLQAHIPWTNHLGLFRSLLAFSTLITFIFNDVDVLSHRVPMSEENYHYPDIAKIGLFYLFKANIGIAYWMCCFILSLVVIGVLPRITCLLHWWACFSINTGLTVIDGGEQVCTVISFLLIPILILDRRLWHWEPSVSNKGRFSLMVANIGVVLLRIQISFIYFHSFLSKLSVPEWNDGSVLHYWFSDSILGMSSWSYSLVGELIVRNQYLIFFCTWFSLLLELLIASSILINQKAGKLAILVMGCGFHFLIGISFGIWSFSFTMMSLLLFYLSDNKNYQFGRKESKRDRLILA